MTEPHKEREIREIFDDLPDATFVCMFVQMMHDLMAVNGMPFDLQGGVLTNPVTGNPHTITPSMMMDELRDRYGKAALLEMQGGKVRQ